MSDSKVFMFPESERSTDAALWATLANTRNNCDPMAMMAMMGGGMGGFGGGAWNNPLTHTISSCD